MTGPLAGMLAASWLDMRLLGEATLIGVAAVVLGYLVTRVWPKGLNPQLFGVLAALAFTGGLAYAGNTGAGIALVILLIVGLILGGAALVL